MPADDILLDAEERMEKAVEVFRHALTGIRTGRACRYGFTLKVAGPLHRPGINGGDDPCPVRTERR